MAGRKTVQGRPNKTVRVVAIGLCALVAFLDGADTQSLAIAASVMVHDLAIQPSQLGLVFALGALGIALGAVLSGPLADRAGPRRVLAATTLWFGVFQLASAYATDLPSLLVLRTLAGLGLGGAAPCFLALAAGHVGADRRAAALSLLWACFPLGALIGGVVNGWLIENHGWRTMFIAGGILPILVAILVYGLATEAPSPESTPKPTKRGGSMIWWREPDLRSRLLLIWSVFFASFGALAGVVLWLPSILVKAGLPTSQGGLILSWHAAGALLSMAVAGYLIKRFGPMVLSVSLLSGAVALAATGLAIPDFAGVATGMVLVGALFGLAGSGAIAAAGTLLPTEGRSSGLGWSMGIGRLAQVLVPFVMGMGFERFTPLAVFLGLAAVPAIVSVAAWRFALLERGR